MEGKIDYHVYNNNTNLIDIIKKDIIVEWIIINFLLTKKSFLNIENFN